MKALRLLTFINSLPSAFLTMPRAAAQDVPSGGGYRLDWFTLDGGGGTCAGGEFTLTGSIGQHDAAPAATARDNRYTLEPGFWTAVVNQPGLPLLQMSVAASGVVLWWESEARFVLQHSSDLVAWEDAPEAAVVAGLTNTVTQNTGSDTRRRFYRLRPR